MTYNFDPDRWYENRVRLLDHRLKSGEIDELRFHQGVEDLDRRLEEMMQRLDGSYVLPDGGGGA